MNPITTTQAPAAIGPYSQAMRVGDLLFTSGQIALTPAGEFVDGDINAQTKQVLENLGAILKAAGASPESVAKTTIYLANMEDFVVVNGLYEGFFGAHKPARSTIAVKTLPKNALIEIEAIAHIG
jgi:2-iminobutanoate/2-iminopropanoate deaminase